MVEGSGTEWVGPAVMLGALNSVVYFFEQFFAKALVEQNRKDIARQIIVV